MPMRTRSQSRQNMPQANKTEETREEFFQEHSSPQLKRRALRNRARSKDGKPEEGLKKSRDEPRVHDEPDWRASNTMDGTEQEGDDSLDEDMSHVGIRDRPKRQGESALPSIRNQSFCQEGKAATKHRKEIILPKTGTGIDKKRKGTTKLHQSDRDGTNKYSKLMVVFVCVALAIPLVAGVHAIWFRDVGKPVSALTQPNFRDRMQELKSLFPAQEEHFWDVIEAAVEDHLAQDSEPVAPIVLMFGSRPDAAKSSECLAKQLQSVLSKTLQANRSGVTLIDGKYYASRVAHEAKEEIDRHLRAGFESGQKAAVVLNLDALPPCSILIFHSYCENDDARYKDAALIFTVTLDEERPPGRDEHGPKLVNLKGQEAYRISEHLLRTWVDKCDKLPEEKVEAMLSRVANNVGIVQKEKSTSC